MRESSSGGIDWKAESFSSLHSPSHLSFSVPHITLTFPSSFYYEMSTRLRKFSEGVPRFFPFKSAAKTVVEREKKPLWSTLSWDAERRSRSPSTLSRPRLHSDGEEKEEKKEDEEKMDMEGYCRHCLWMAEHKRKVLKVRQSSKIHALSGTVFLSLFLDPREEPVVSLSGRTGVRSHSSRSSIGRKIER